MHTHVHAFLIFGLCNYYLKREGSVMFVVILCILFCGFCESIYMCALQYCRQVKSINEKFYFTVLSHDIFWRRVTGSRTHGTAGKDRAV